MGKKQFSSGNKPDDNSTSLGIHPAPAGDTIHEHHQSGNRSQPCAYCVKERSRDSDAKSRKHRRLVRTRLNSPIVVRLQDAIKVSIRSKGKTSTSIKSGNNAVDDSECKKETVSLNNSFTSTANDTSSTNGYTMSKGDKNFNAMLSAIEKAHSKDETALTFAFDNLTDILVDSKDKVITHNVLNNCVKFQNSITDKTIKRGLDPDNIELICNDLSSKNSVAESDDFCDDSEQSENSSVVSCTEDSVSDSDISSSSSESLSDDLSKEELERLAEYASGAPLTRYDCPPHECSECMAAYYAYTQWCYQGYDWYNNGYTYPSTTNPSFDTISQTYCSDCTQDTTTTDSPFSDSEDEVNKPSFHVLIKGIKKVEVSVGWLRKNRKKRHSSSSSSRSHSSSVPIQTDNKHLMNNSVSVDLTNSDVEFSVQYLPERYSKKRSNHHGHYPNHHGHYPDLSGHQLNHHNKHPYHHHHHNVLQHGAVPPTPPPTPQSPQSHQSFMYDDWSAYYPGYNYGFLPYAMPYYMLPPYYCLFPFYTIPKPLCVPRDLRCLKSQRLCMVPAHEIKSCKFNI